MKVHTYIHEKRALKIADSFLAVLIAASKYRLFYFFQEKRAKCSVYLSQISRVFP